MGASHSKQDTEQVFYNPVPIQVSSELATQLSDTSLSPEVSPTRHAILDQSVRAKISAEAARLRGRNDNDNDNDDHHDEGVDIVQREIEAALERENLDRERGMAGDAVAADADADAAHGDVKNSTVLLGDLEEVRQKVDRYRVRASLADHLGVKEAREAVASCYQANPTTTLNCWSEVAAFRSAVAELEQVVPFLFIPCLAVNADLVTSSNMLTRYGSQFVAFIDILQPRIID
ncbi:hypothetical protein BJV77DRAFT_940284 [Russula vinacea]|nr:hypothetical protein BJV77DRAFT_940284 [Russula vinacea]